MQVVLFNAHKTVVVVIVTVLYTVSQKMSHLWLAIILTYTVQLR